MVSLVDTVLRRTAEPQTVGLSSDDLRTRLAEYRSALTHHRAALAALEEAIGERRVAKAMGETVDAAAFADLNDQAEALARTVREDEAVITGLEAKLATHDDGERQRRLDAAQTELATLAEEGWRLEGEYITAAEHLVATARELLATRERFEVIASESFRLDPNCGHGQRQPNRPFAIPAVYTDSSLPYVPFAHWLADWKADHP